MRDIIPDTKDWTWVLSRPCHECGAEVSTLTAADIEHRTRKKALEWKKVLATPSARIRPGEHTWSALEYGCHARDVFTTFHARISLVMHEKNPVFENWDQDATAIELDYDKQNPALVAQQIEWAATTLADLIATITPEQLTQLGRRSNGTELTLEKWLQYYIHDVLHHMWDVTGGKQA